MPELLKNIYSKKFFEEFTNSLQQVLTNFNSKSFMSLIYNNEWKGMELKQRMRHVSSILKIFLPKDFNHSAKIIVNIVNQLIKDGKKEISIEYMLLPDFIEQNGLNHLEISLQTFESITPFTSCEFAIRPFLIKYPMETMNQMLKWSKHKNHLVRRFSTEGCRPRLPWAIAIPELKNNPSSILPILENLKNDESEFVRKGVANNLNDISKDNPGTIINLVKKWQGKTKNTDLIIKHGSRTLLKQGNHKIMQIFGFGSTKNIQLNKFEIITPKVKIGNYLMFSFLLVNSNNKPTKIRLEYGLYYKKANGQLSKKVFKISEKVYAKNSTTLLTRKQSFKMITTRKFYLGLHQVSLIVNGKEKETLDFQLVENY